MSRSGRPEGEWRRMPAEADRGALRHCLFLSLACLLAAVFSVAAQAVVLAGPGGTAEQGRRVVQAEPAPGTGQAGLVLVQARIEAVDPAGRWLRLQGQPVGLHPTALRIVGAGGLVVPGLQSLRPGLNIRFALAPEPALPAGQAPPAAMDRPIVLIYLEPRP